MGANWWRWWRAMDEVDWVDMMSRSGAAGALVEAGQPESWEREELYERQQQRPPLFFVE